MQGSANQHCTKPGSAQSSPLVPWPGALLQLSSQPEESSKQNLPYFLWSCWACYKCYECIVTENSSAENVYLVYLICLWMSLELKSIFGKETVWLLLYKMEPPVRSSAAHPTCETHTVCICLVNCHRGSTIITICEIASHKKPASVKLLPSKARSTSSTGNKSHQLRGGSW